MLCNEQGIKYPWQHIYTSPKITQTYKDIATNKEITSIHPPKTNINIQGTYLAIPLVKINTGQDITKDIIYQNNYSNEILNTIGQQLTRIDNRTLDITKKEDIINENLKTLCKHLKKVEETEIDDESNTASITNQITPISNPLFKPQELEENTNLGYNPKLVKELGEKLSELRINTINYDSDNSSDNEETKISQIQDQFINNTQINKLNFKGNYASTSRPGTLNYYPRPTFPDVSI